MKKPIGRARTYESDRADVDTGRVARHEAARQATVKAGAARAQRQGLGRIAARHSKGY